MGGRGSSSIQTSSRERAESVLQAMRDAGMNPTKSVAETEKILEKYDSKQATFDRQYQERVKQIQRDRAKKQAQRKKYQSQNDQVRQTMNEASRLATAGNYKEAQKLINKADKLNDAIPDNVKMWNTKLKPKKLDWSDLK